MHTHCAKYIKHVCLLTCSSGLVSALSNPDWPIRRAAADAVKALAIALGPDLDSPSQPALTSGVQSVSCRAAEALEKCRFDKVRPVREVVQEAQAVLLDLQVICGSACKACHCHLHCRNCMASKLHWIKLQASIRQAHVQHSAYFGIPVAPVQLPPSSQKDWLTGVAPPSCTSSVAQHSMFCSMCGSASAGVCKQWQQQLWLECLVGTQATS